MARIVPSLLLTSGFLLAVACSDSPTAPAAPSSPVTPSLSRDGADREFDAQGNKSERHVFELANSLGDRAARAARGGGGTGISYHGGPVLQAATNVVAVYWGASPVYFGGPNPGTYNTSSNSGDNSLVGTFLSNLGGSAYFNINTTYKDGFGQAIKNVVNYTGYWANGTGVPSNGQNVSDAAMISMLQSGFNSGALTYKAGTLYLIFTAGSVNLGGGFGTQSCAYHTHGTVSVNGTTRTVLYAAMPYVNAYPSACTNNSPSPNGDPSADREVNVLAHEIEETTTDMMGSAWFDSRGYENADKCAWNFGSMYTTANGGWANMNIGGKDWLVQQNWINSGSGGCRLSW